MPLTGSADLRRRTSPLEVRELLFRFADVVARLAGALSRRLGAGSGGVIPGRVTLAWNPQAVRRLSRGRQIVLVSGTNGKTTTTCMIAAALSSLGEVITNEGGSNLEAGLVSALLGRRAARLAVLEVDEVVLPRAVATTKAVALVLLNLSRDQLDRTWEVSQHVRSWAEAIADTPALIVANADDPLVVCAVLRARPDAHDVVWVAAGARWRGDVPLCPRCGAGWGNQEAAWSCANCGLRPPDGTWSVCGDVLVTPDGQRLPLNLQLPGAANAGNAVIAVAAAAGMGVPPETSLPLLGRIKDVDGRHMHVVTDGRELELLLVKNPASWLAALDEVSLTDDALLLVINARTADGTDPSWLWDVAFERLAGRSIVVGGERALDLSTRLHYAEVPHIVRGDLSDALEALPRGRVSILANYTAFVQTRALLAERRP